MVWDTISKHPIVTYGSDLRSRISYLQYRDVKYYSSTTLPDASKAFLLDLGDNMGS